MLEKNPGQLSQNCTLAICTILYSYDALQLKDWVNLQDIIPDPRPKIDKKYISEPLREYIEFNEASFASMNTYILELCYRHQLTLEEVNKVGHNFSYNPSKLANRESKSSAMFAVEFE